MESGRVGSNLLDPSADEFYPSVSLPPVPGPAPVNNVSVYLGPAQIFYQPYALPHPPPPPLFHPPASPAPAMPPTPLAEGATRAVALSMLPRGIGEDGLSAEMEAFGGVRWVDAAMLAKEGAAMVHFYDIRSAQAAVAEIQQQFSLWQQPGFEHGVAPTATAENCSVQATSWCFNVGFQPEFAAFAGEAYRGLIDGQPVWAEFSRSSYGTDPNQGSIFVFNSDSSISLIVLRQLFEAFGSVKEVREMASKPHHRFVEYFDIRDAGRAFTELNGHVIHGGRLMLEFTKPAYQARHQFSNYSRMSSSSHFSSKMPPRLQRSNPSQHSGKWTTSISSSSSSSSSTAAPATEVSSSSREGKGGVYVKRSIQGGGGGGGSGCCSISESSISIDNSKSINFNYPTSSTSSPSFSTLKQQQRRQQLQHSSSSSGSSNRKSWKNHPKNGGGGGESRFLFKEEDLQASPTSRRGDSRTTVMIKNIPNKYSLKLLLNMLDNHCIHCNEQIAGGEDVEPFSAYDFIYLPIDFHNKCNVGYGFVNMTSPEAVLRLYKTFHDQPWEVFNSRKICQVTYARLQGLEALMEHFRNSKFACDNDEYLPVVFSPPRDGSQLTEPATVVGRRESINLTSPVLGGLDDAAAALGPDFGGASSTTASTHVPSDDNADCDDDVDRELEFGVAVVHHDEGGCDADRGSGLSEAFANLFSRAK